MSSVLCFHHYVGSVDLTQAIRLLQHMPLPEKTFSVSRIDIFAIKLWKDGRGYLLILEI